ncbi:XrtA system polysaccharide chain length determinant [Sphingosinicella rhizophila]|uniref:GNVR domain-containing protein n=1 Tax=Sphingosinicella rhizophila TaxID=3050082 RepID=A0ABU3Q496_9SPHN|nr:XrtA system polysaccharide chain length determinant [Sphingosinicella sp. GR2756]MDT9597760.1 GNVR domain-containing protein [Sphingosinicella sp. GR2756]
MDGLYDQMRLAIHQVWKRRWLALAVAWGLCLIGWLVIALIPNSYESKAKVFVQMQSALPSQAGITPMDRANDLMRMRQTLTSTASLEKVVRRTDLNNLVASPQDLAVQVGKLRESIKVTAQQDNLFEIAATTSVSGFSNRQNAKTAAAIVQNLLDVFGETGGTGDGADTVQTLAFLDEELKRREVGLQEAEQRRVEFEQRFLGLLPGEGSIAQRMSIARAELANVDQQLIQAQSALASLRGQLNSTAPTIAGSYEAGGGYGPASQQIAQLEAQISQGAARGWTDQHPDLVATRAQIARLKPQAAQERAAAGGRPPGASNPAYVSLRAMVAEKEAQAAAASARKNQLQSDMAQLSSRQSSEPGVAAEQARLNRDYEVLKRQYDKLLEDREQLRLRSDVETKTVPIKFRIIDPPNQPLVPSTPNRPLFLSLILVFGLGAGVAAAFAKAQLVTTFPTRNRLQEATGLPVLGAISEFITPDRKVRDRQRLIWLGGAGGALFASYAILMLVEFWQRSTVA